MREFELVDDFGRRTVFTGLRLVGESTDTAAGTKPQWIDVDVYRTRLGNYIVARTTHYRIRHAREDCARAEGYELMDPTVLDTYPCPACSRDGLVEGGFAQADRISIEVYTSPEQLIENFKVDGRYSQLARTILADVAEQDDKVDAAWNTVVVP